MATVLKFEISKLIAWNKAAGAPGKIAHGPNQ